MNPQTTEATNSNPFQANTPARHPKKQNKLSSGLKGFFSSKIFLLAVILIQLAAIVWLLNPVERYKDFQNQQAVKSVTQLVQVPAEQPIIALVADADELRSENSIQAEVYKDAQNGDYVLGYNERMIIYRKNENRIIYDGDTPQMRLQKAQQQIVNEIVDVVKQKGLIPQNSTETPQVSVITDVTALRKQDEVFYANARNNDVLVIFPVEEVIVIYNASTKEVVNSGEYSTQIK